MTDVWDYAALSLSPVAYWPLDDAGAWADATGNGHDVSSTTGTVSATTLSDGKPGASFNGSSYLTVPDHVDLRPENYGGFSASFWVECNLPGEGGGVISKHGSWNGLGYGIEAGTPYGAPWIVTQGDRWTAASYPVADSVSSHVVVTFDWTTQSEANSAIFYLDGAAVAETEYASAPPWTMSSTSAVSLLIGRMGQYGGNFTGKISKVAWYDRVLTPTEVTTLSEGLNLGKTGQRPGSGNLRAALQAVADGNAGRFYVAADGTTVLQWRDAETGKSTALTLNADQVSPWYSGITLSPGFAETVNEVVLRLADGTEVSAQAAERTAVVETVSLVLDTLLTDAGEAADLAGFLASYMARPSRVVTEVVCKPQGWSSYDPALAAALELGDRVLVNLPGGDTFDGTVERVAWDFDREVTLRLGLDRYDPGGFGNADWFVIDSSALDGADVLAY